MLQTVSTRDFFCLQVFGALDAGSHRDRESGSVRETDSSAPHVPGFCSSRFLLRIPASTATSRRLEDLSSLQGSRQMARPSPARRRSLGIGATPNASVPQILLHEGGSSSSFDRPRLPSAGRQRDPHPSTAQNRCQSFLATPPSFTCTLPRPASQPTVSITSDSRSLADKAVTTGSEPDPGPSCCHPSWNWTGELSPTR